MRAVPDTRYHVVDRGVAGRDGAVPVRDYVPDGESTAAPLLWVHGGGFVSGGLDQKESDAPARYLAARGRRVRTVAYRLAPFFNPFGDPDLRPRKGRFPAALHDVVDVARDLAAVTGQTIALGGASAGANLAAGAALMMRDEGALDITTLVFAYGAFHSTLPEDDDVERVLRDPLARVMFSQKMVARIAANYTGDATPPPPGYAFQGGADLRGLTSAFLLDASTDRLRKSGHAFAAELRIAGAEVRSEVYRGRHGFLNSARKSGFDDRMHEVDAWLRAHDARP